MNTKFIVWVIIWGIALLWGMIALLKGTGAVASNDALTPSDTSVTIEQNNLDLGQIPMSEGKVQIPFEFTNEGWEPVMVQSAYTSCMCTEGVIIKNDGTQSSTIGMHTQQKNINMEIAPWETAQLVAIFDPNAHGPNATWPIVRHVYVATNATKTPQLDFVFEGTVVK